MKGERKEDDAVGWTMRVLRADYARVLLLVEEQKTMIAALPDGKERRFLQRDLDTWMVDINGQIEFKRGLMAVQGIEGDPRTYMYSEEHLEDMYKRLKGIQFEDDEQGMPSASA